MNSPNPKASSSARAPLLKVAVTGSAGSGKTAVCARLKTLGLTVISTDTLAREVAAPGSSGLAEIVKCFGPEVLQVDGSLNRPALRRIITADEKVRRSLEKILHPKIAERMETEMVRGAAEGRNIFFVEVPLLFEAGWNDYFDVIVTVSANKERRIRRLMTRDRVSRQEARDLLKIQMPEQEKIEHSDFIIKNSGSLEQLNAEVDRFLKNFLSKMSKNDESA